MRRWLRDHCPSQSDESPIARALDRGNDQETVAEISERAGCVPAEQIALDNLTAQEAVGLIVRVLNRDQAEIVMLRVLGDLSTAQVAQVMGRDVVWVGFNQHRALKRLAKRFPSKVMR